MQAIITKYLGPTNSRGGRVRAKAQAGSVSVSWDHALSTEENHHRAAQALARKLSWTGPSYGRLIGGGLPDGAGNAYVFHSPRHTRVRGSR